MNKPKEIPIIFSNDMVKAILGGIKTETRRTRGLWLNKASFSDEWTYTECFLGGMPLPKDAEWMAGLLHLPTGEKMADRSPYGKPGDLLYVRERFTDSFHQILIKNPKMPYSYYADCDAESLEIAKEYGYKWKPSIHLPKSGSRIWLMVEEIKVERLNDITEQSAINEGCPLYGPFGEYRGSKHPNGGSMKYRAYSKAVSAFACIWESINGEKSWKENPWVWVVKFKVLSSTGRPSDSEIRENYLEISKEIQP